MGISDRYASAIRSSNLSVDERTTYSDTDVLGAMGLAAARYPLGAALARLLYGDNHASQEVVSILAERAWPKARHYGAKVTREDAKLVAEACLAWHRDGTCKHCGGHGRQLIKGTKTLGDRECHVCKGAGKLPLERQFLVEPVRQLARWLVSEMEREVAFVIPEMRSRVGSDAG